MRRPCDLTKSELIHIIFSIQQLLYLDDAEDQDPFWNPQKQWSGADVCQTIATLLDEHGLVPDQPQTF